MIRTTDMNQVAVYWQPGIPDGTGSFDFTSVIPVEIMCRFQDQQNLFRDAQGREVRTSRVAYVDREVVVGGFIAPGSLADANLTIEPYRNSSASLILNVVKSPSLSADEFLIKVML